MTRIVVILGESVCPADRAAVATAVALGGRITALSSSETTLRYAAAAGAKVQWLNGHVPVYDLALLGSYDEAFAAQVAGNAPLVLDALRVERGEGDAAGWRITQDLGRGEKQILHTRDSAVVMMSDDAPNALYVSRYRRGRTTLPAGGVAPTPLKWHAVRPRVRTGDLTQKTAGSAADRAALALGIAGGEARHDDHIIEADARTCAEHLLRYLAHHGFIDRAATVESTVAAPAARSSVPSNAAAATACSTIPANLARRPRPVGEATPRTVRGPYPLEVN
jgi:hypothetical protein